MENIGKKRFSKESILEMERIICLTLNFDLNKPTLCKMYYLISYPILIELNLTKKQGEKLNKSCYYQLVKVLADC